MRSVIKQIDEYFHGKRREFTFPIRPKGTDFQVKVWKLLSRIPYGTSLAYVKVAQAYGDAKMVRAIACAIAKNPLLIVIPCHRVVGSDGSLVGYSGGITTKRRLLELEGYPKQLTVL
jgi:methylated-DNA-[protein]-cysteine S-methyltransferase